MVDKIERIHQMMEELAAAIKDAFPNYTNAGTIVSANGNMSISVTEWANEAVSIGECPRRSLFEQDKSNGEWKKDDSEHTNAYYARNGMLKEA